MYNYYYHFTDKVTVCYSNREQKIPTPRLLKEYLLKSTTFNRHSEIIYSCMSKGTVLNNPWQVDPQMAMESLGESCV